MTSASLTHIESAPLRAAPGGAPESARAGLLEFFLVGGATLVLLPVSWLCRRAFGSEPTEIAADFWMYHAAFVINDPHFAVTYLLFYKGARERALGRAFPPAQRARYVFAGLIVPAALIAWAAAAITMQSGQVMGWMVQLMFFLVGWHYVKQGFGVVSVLSARRGVRYTLAERRALLFHCFAGWAYAWASPADPGKLSVEKGVIYTTLAHGAALERATQILFFLSAIPVAWVLFQKRRVEGRLPPLGPLVGFLITIWVWTVYSAFDPVVLYVIPALHSVQYLYFVWLLKRNEARSEEGPPLFGRPPRVRVGFLLAGALLLGWFLFRGAPSALDALFFPEIRRRIPLAGGLGPTPYWAAIFVVVNIHHYFMDNVIWRRENPDMRHLAS